MDPVVDVVGRAKTPQINSFKKAINKSLPYSLIRNTSIEIILPIAPAV